MNTFFHPSKTYKPSFLGSEISVPIHFEDFEGSLEVATHPKQQLSQPKLLSQARSRSSLQFQLANVRSSSGSSLLLATAGGSFPISSGTTTTRSEP